MARTVAARHRMCRRVGEPLCGLPDCPALKRPYPPGQHGRIARRRASQYGLQLMEKQKLKFLYGVTERQLRNYFERATRARGRTGERLLQYLETRLDNVVYRLGLAPTLPAARQLVVHGHIRVNGRKVDRPGFAVRPNDEITVRERSKTLQPVTQGLEQRAAPPPYMELDRERLRGRLLRVPSREEMPVKVDESLVVEFYAR
ncbi:30S ribosomal protein S4 [Carboxydochorda subterranea]|uniref:Small ribosomal subunit protein uS4 n=1 Tax=Carboxydichorda subterranea TaxID=3109565 RepID=A0ABZ1BVI6_9FIRM|nr:30S ribosomal protein S4 [Limnochorda sp. L945t]WRP16809.1 30S ribosomal protein S4 [Limnochorda sp. L945t]